jgi:UDP-N-acetylmuramoyl-tripeptide--D-alanyl-D-alanine ligase
MSEIWNESLFKKVTGVGAGVNWQASGISLDTRTLKKGDIYIALKGERVDGHTFLNEAYNKGAVLAIVNYKPQNAPAKLPLIIVEDQIEVLNKLAAYKRDNFKGKVIGITGTVGKTTTKEALAKIIGDQATCFATVESYNNKIGLSLCLAGMDESLYDYAIFEIGMSLKGEISFLTKVVRPDIAIITTITPVHMEFFHSLEEVASAKAEIFEGMNENGIVLLNKDNQYYEYLIKKAAAHNIKNVYSFGKNYVCHFKLTNFQQTDNGAEMEVEIEDLNSFKIAINHLNEEMAVNFLSVIGVAYILGFDIEKAAQSFEQFFPIAGRGRIRTINLEGKNIIILDESYNASPAAMNAALSTLGKKKWNGRKVAIMGDMRELGARTLEFHRELEKSITYNMIDKVITCGNFIESLYQILPESKRLGHFPNVDALIPRLSDLLEDNDYVLIKASKSVGFQRLVKYLEGTYAL